MSRPKRQQEDYPSSHLKVDQFLLNVSKAAVSSVQLTHASGGYGELLCNLSNSYKFLFEYWVKRQAFLRETSVEPVPADCTLAWINLGDWLLPWK